MRAYKPLVLTAPKLFRTFHHGELPLWRDFIGLWKIRYRVKSYKNTIDPPRRDHLHEQIK